MRRRMSGYDEFFGAGGGSMSSGAISVDMVRDSIF